MSDIHQIPGQPFVQAYPLTYREWTTGLWMSWSIGEGRVWPVENDSNFGPEQGQRQVWTYYADDLPERFPSGSPTEVAPGVWYDHDWQMIELISQNGETQYLYAPAWLFWNIPAETAQQIERAELIVNIHASSERNPDNLPFLVQLRNDIRDLQGWYPHPNTYRTMTGGSVVPALTGLEIAANNSSGESHRYSDPYIDVALWGPYPPRHVLPLSTAALEQLRRGGRFGLMLGFDGTSAPVNPDNYLNIECGYGTWDAAPPGDVMNAGFGLPTLRLWIGGEILVAGESTITVTAEGHIRTPPVPLLTHRARAIRDRS